MKEYQKVRLEIIKYNDMDIVRTSLTVGENGSNDNPIEWEDVQFGS